MSNNKLAKLLTEHTRLGREIGVTEADCEPQSRRIAKTIPLVTTQIPRYPRGKQSPIATRNPQVEAISWRERSPRAAIRPSNASLVPLLLPRFPWRTQPHRDDLA